MLRFTAADAIPRDRWQRPVIDGKAYTRATTLANALDDKNNLIRWSSRMTALGLASSPDLIAEVAVASPEDKKALDSITERAQDRAGARSGASIGTATHAVTELIDAGESVKGIPSDVLRDARAYSSWCAEHGLVPLAAECFVVNEGLQAAGTFDRLMQGPHKAIIADLKTSGNPDSARWSGLAWSIQLAVYAHGRPWHPEKGWLDWEDLGLPAPDLRRGLVIHVVQGTGDVSAYSIDLVAGIEAARIARQVFDLRKRTDLYTAL